MKSFSNGSIYEDELVTRFQSWERILALNEVGFIFFYPFTEHARHARFFVKWYESRHKIAPKIVSVLTMTEETSDFNLTDENMKNGIIVDAAELLLKPDTIRLFHTLIERARFNDTSALFLIEMTPFEYLEYVKQFKYTTYFKNLVSYPLYDKKNILKFISFIENEWSFKLPKPIRDSLYEETGGYLWLVKEILRQVKSENKTFTEIISSAAYIYRTENIWNNLPKIVRDLSCELFRSGSVQKNSYSDHLISTRFFNAECLDRMPMFLKRLVRTHLSTKIELANHHVHINSIDVSTSFSPYEYKILSLLVENSGIYISRDSIAKARWGSNWTDMYSDWALDQAIYRLRNKLNKFDKTIVISSQRNKGYAITL